MVDLSITRYWTTNDHKKSVPVWRVRHVPSGFDALAYRCSLEEDFDGAPRCYGAPNPGRFGDPVNAASNPDTSLQADIVAREPYQPPDRANARAALDYLGNATSPHKNFGLGDDYAWVGLISMAPSEVRKVPNANPKLPPINVPSLDMRRGLGAKYRKNAQGELVTGPKGEHFYPVIQGPDAPAKGFYISPTAVARDPDLPLTDQNRYFDASAIPYQAFNSWMLTAGAVHVNKGDFGLVIDPLTSVASGLVLADAGAGNKAGEVSTFLLGFLGGNNERDFTFLLFPNSGGGSILPTANAPTAASAGALNNLPKLNDDSDAATQLVLFLALDCNYTKYSQVKSGSLSRDAMVEAEIAYIDMRQLLKPYKLLESDATLGVE